MSSKCLVIVKRIYWHKIFGNIIYAIVVVVCRKRKPSWIPFEKNMMSHHFDLSLKTHRSIKFK